MIRRWWILATFATLAIGLLLMRAAQLQIIQGTELRAQAEDNRVTTFELEAPRGLIYDTTGKLLAENIASTDVFVNPLSLPQGDREAPVIDLLLEMTDLAIGDITEIFNEARETQRQVRLLKAIDHEMVVAIEHAQNELPGIVLAPSLVRQYTHGHLTAHTIGYDDRTGIEKSYNELLRGEDGTVYQEISANGRTLRKLTTEESVPGSDITTTLDIELVSMISDLLAEKEKQGAIIVLNAKTGEIVAMYSNPSFDANVFSQPQLSDQVPNIIKDESQPLFSRATDGTFPPGSTIKPLVAAAALEEGIVTANTSFYSSGGINIGPWSFPDWKAGGHGQTNVYKAIAESVNTFFYLVTGGDETRNGLGVEKTTGYLKKFGWGQATGIDLPSEAEGFLPSINWKEEAKGEPWYIGDTYHLAIGQGDVLVTPLQVATATAGIANGGTMVKPHLVKRDDPPSGYELEFSKQTIDTVREAMRETVVGNKGSGRSLASLPIELAGKTGTAQIGGTEETHAWFTSFGPYQDPDLVVTVLLERGGEGDKDAVPVAKEIWQWWHEHRS